MLGLLDELGALGDHDAHDRAPCDGWGLPRGHDSGREKRWALPMWGHTYAWTLARICRWWLRSWWTHSARRSAIDRRPTVGWRPARARSSGLSASTTAMPASRRRVHSARIAAGSFSQSRRSRATALWSQARNRGSGSARSVRTRPGEAALVSLDQMADHLERAPFPGRGVPAQHGGRQPGALHPHGEERGAERVRHLARAERRRGVGARRRHGSSIVAHRGGRVSPGGGTSGTRPRAAPPRRPRATASGPRGSRHGRRAR